MDRPDRAGRWARRLGTAFLAAAGFLLLFHAAGAWYFSEVLHDRALGGAERRAALKPDYDLEVVGSDGETISISLPGDPGALLTEGTWGLEWPEGYGRLGSIQTTGNDVVVREFDPVIGDPPQPGTQVRLDERAFPGDPETGLGIAFEDVAFESALGSFPAWFVPGERDTWAILVHGNAMTRRDALRTLPAVVAAGFPALVITYRNDPGAPEDPSGLLRYGLTEWRDLEAAVRFARGQGARRVVLIGYSMGGGIVVSFLERSPLARRVAGAVLEAPALDFGRAVDFQASYERLPLLPLPLPRSLTALAKWLGSVRFGVDWEALDYLAGAERLATPILLIHGTADRDVPIATSEELARLRPDLVTLERFEGAAHMEAWNVAPRRHEGLIRDFLLGVAG